MREGSFEFLIMPFGFVFQRRMAKILEDFLFKFVVVYFDDILIYLRVEHERIIRCEFSAKNEIFCWINEFANLHNGLCVFFSPPFQVQLMIWTFFKNGAYLSNFLIRQNSAVMPLYLKVCESKLLCEFWLITIMLERMNNLDVLLQKRDDSTHKFLMQKVGEIEP